MGSSATESTTGALSAVRWGGATAAAALLLTAGCQSIWAVPTPNVGWPDGSSRTSNDERVDRALEWADAELRRSSTFETLIGARSFQDDASWEPIDHQLDLGIGVQVPFLGDRSFHLDHATDWISWDLGFAYASDRSERTTATLESKVYDLAVGLLAQPPDPSLRLRPFVGAGWNTGFARIEAERNGSTERDRDVVAGPYVRGGLRFYWEPRRFFGAEVRWRTGDDGNPVDLIGGDIESTTLSLVFGATF